MKIKEIQEIGQDFYDCLNSNTTLLFLFGNKKSTEFFINKDTNIDVFIPVMEAFIRSCGVCERLYWLPWYKGRVMVSKEKGLSEKFKRSGFRGKKGNIIAGKFFGIPECCMEKYLEDKNGMSSRKSFFRYKNQLIELKMEKDPYEIWWGISNNINCDGVGFVPCHPNCKEARKISNQLKKIKKKMGFKD